MRQFPAHRLGRATVTRPYPPPRAEVSRRYGKYRGLLSQFKVGVVALHPSVSPKGNRLAYDQILGSSSIWVVELVEIDDKNSRMQVTATGPQSSRRTAKKSCLNPTGQGQWRSGPAREMVPV